MIADISRPYRRTRRDWRAERRILLAALTAVLVAVALLVYLGNVAYGGSSGGTQTIRVAPGQSVWSIAAARYGDDGDLRSRVDQILSLNHLQGGVVVPGQTLTLPPP
jgi:LysM domain